MLVILDENSIHAVLDTCIKQKINEIKQVVHVHILYNRWKPTFGLTSLTSKKRDTHGFHTMVLYLYMICSNVIPSFVQHLIFLSFNILVQQFNQSVFCQIDLFKGKLNVQFGNFIFF